MDVALDVHAQFSRAAHGVRRRAGRSDDRQRQRSPLGRRAERCQVDELRRRFRRRLHERDDVGVSAGLVERRALRARLKAADGVAADGVRRRRRHLRQQNARHHDENDERIPATTSLHRSYSTPKIPEQERKNIRVLFDHFRDRLSGAVPGLRLDADQDGGGVAVGRLQPRGELLRHAGRHAIVRVRRRDQGRRVGDAVLHVVERRVLVEEGEVCRVIGRSVLGDPEPADGEEVITEHVGDRHAADDGAEEIRPLHHDRPGEKAPVAAAFNRNLPAGRPPARAEPFGGRDEVVEHVLLALEHPGLVPGFPVFPAAAQIGDRVDPALVDQHEVGRIERGREGNVEAPVPRQQHRPPAVRRQPFAVHQEHRHLRAVLRGVPHLCRLVLRGIDPPLARAERRQRLRREVVAIVCRRIDEGAEADEHLVVFGASADAGDRADRRQIDRAGRPPGEIEEPDAVAGVLQVRRDERAVDEERRRQLVGRFRNHLHRRHVGPRGIDPDNPAAGRAVVGSEEETRLVSRIESRGLDERVRGREPREQRRRRTSRLVTVQQIDFALVAGPFEGRDDDPPIVVADLDAEDRFAFGGLVEDERVALLRVAEAMVVDLVEVVLVPRFHRAGLREPRVVEPGAVFHPRDRHELRPLQAVGPIGAALDVADEDLLPIAAARREPVGDNRSRGVDFHGRQRDGPPPPGAPIVFGSMSTRGDASAPSCT